MSMTNLTGETKPTPKTVWVWECTEQQLDDAVRNFLYKCIALADILAHEVLMERFRSAANSEEYRRAQVASREEQIDLLRGKFLDSFKKQVNEYIRPFCMKEMEQRFCMLIDIPKCLCTPHMGNIMRAFEQDANCFSSYDIMQQEYWLKPNLTKKIIQNREYIPRKERLYE